MRTIDHWTIQVTWSDGEKEFLDHIPESNHIESYLDALQEERSENLDDEEEERLIKRLGEIESEQVVAFGLHRISGGFVKAELDYVEGDKIYITIIDGVRSDCENKINYTHCSLWRNTLEYTD